MSLHRRIATLGVILLSVVGLNSGAVAAKANVLDTVKNLIPFGCNHVLSSQASCFGLTIGNAAASGPTGYGPADIQKAYNLVGVPVTPGTTVGTVDAYDDPNAEADLQKYRAQYGLPVCNTANGCFKKLNQNGVAGSYPSSNTGWAQEVALDLDTISATCPLCHITLVEANTQDAVNFDAAMDAAWASGVNAVSNSYGFAETAGQLTNDDPHYNHPGVTASTGDSGYGVSFPSTSQYVTAVGGTTLTKDTSARGFSETAWSGSGSGCSAFEPKPAWQQDANCAKRFVADVSADADPNTGLATYNTFVTATKIGLLGLGGTTTGGGWLQVGGTSLSSPIVATIYAIAHNGAGPSSPYINAASLYDVVSGKNCTATKSGLLGLTKGKSCPNSYYDTAGPGLDGPTGLGTPHGIGAF